MTFHFPLTFNRFYLPTSGKCLVTLQNKAQEELNKVEDWFNANKMQLNSKKTRYILFNIPRSKRSDPFEIELGGEELHRVSEDTKEKSARLVGVELDEELSFKHHVANVKAKINRVNYILARSKNILPSDIRILIYNSLVRSVLEFASVLYGAARKGTISVLEKVQKKIVRNVKGASSRAHTNEIFSEFAILKVRDLVEFNQAVFGHGVWYETLPKNIRTDFEPHTTAGGIETRAKGKLMFKVPFCKKRFMESAPCLTVPTVWNNLDPTLKTNGKINSFKKNLRKEIVDRYRKEPKCSLDGCYSCARRLEKS